MLQTLREVSHCEVCGNDKLQQVLNMGLHPMCDDLVKIGENRTCKEYPIDILFCDKCITAHQHYQIPKQELFPRSYHYRSRNTADVLDGMSDLVDACKDIYGSLDKANILDVGCNDGSLLSIFKDKGARTFGIEPTDAARDAVTCGDHIILNEYFSEEVAEQFLETYGHPNIITFTNVFAHIEDLQGLIKALKILSSPKTMIVIENHYLGSVLAKDQFDTFYHEHPRTYSYTSFCFIAESLGMKVSQAVFTKRYGGNIRVFIRSGEFSEITNQSELLCEKEKDYGQQLNSLSRRIEKWRKSKFEEIETVVKKQGKITAKAFPGRSAISIKMLKLNEDYISAVYEKPGSEKIGHYVPGTLIPIKSDDEFLDKDGTILNLAWHISGEISSYLRSRGFSGNIIDIISERDFK
jgi:2-polyprenyl-3-methyl-5-hydroxy-6-metoxy-1,4-benzoquinol methylase